MKIKVAFIKNPITGFVFVQTKEGTGIGWGKNEEEARNHALKQIGEWNNNIEDDEMVLEFVTPTQLMEEKRMDDERYVISVARSTRDAPLEISGRRPSTTMIITFPSSRIPTVVRGCGVEEKGSQRESSASFWLRRYIVNLIFG